MSTELDRVASSDPNGDQSTGRPRRWLILAVVVAALVGVAAGLWVRAALSESVPPPSADSVDVGFLQDMTVHHDQAIEMAAIALTAASDPVVRTLAYDVLTAQQNQVGMMQGWLTLWNRPRFPPGDYMTWMPAQQDPSSSHSMPGMAAPTSAEAASGAKSMPGMATAEELRTLRQTSGPRLDVLFLQLLLRHHQGGLAMARYAGDNAAVPAVRTLAAQIVSTQSAESDTIGRMLVDRNSAPLPLN